MRGWLRSGGVGAAALMLMSCELFSGPGQDAGELERLPRELSAAEQEVIAASNAFAFDILRETVARDPAENVMLSPLSASLALGMTMNGARGPTFDGMRHALGFDAVDQDAINQSYRALIDLLLGLDRGVEMRIGNSVWARSGFAFHDAFIQTVRESFDAEVSTLDFAAPDAAPTINEWVSRSTNGRITEIVPAQLPDDAVMYLINAIYFKGSWQDEFDPAQTRPAPFHRADGSTLTVQMMSRGGSVYHHADGDVEIAELRYGRGAFVMDIVLPRPGRQVADIVAALDAERWRGWVDAVRESNVQLSMPKFRLQYETTMNEPLIALGMHSAFTPDGADFTGLAPNGDHLFISNVKQKTFMNVDEEGTEAAAVTSVEVSVTSAPPSMVVDRPFIVAIRERFSGAIMFLGVMGEPTV